MSALSLKEVVNDYGGRAAVVLRNTGRLSVKNDLFGGDYGEQASLRGRLEELLDVLWGVADLHTHPAANYAFGAEPDGWGGVIWGQPGKHHHIPTPALDLPMCDANIHASPGAVVGPVRLAARKVLLGQVEKDLPAGHGQDGFPSFASWPSALSRTHQQMHITWIHRAWKAGLRLMVASTVDSQVIREIWHTHLLDHFVVNPDFDFFSAMKQLSVIRDLVAANTSWMQIVMTPAEAYQAIKEDRLAVVLAVEMDQLTADQIMMLKDQGVRLVTPIHLVNNSFGGAAIYDDLFNSANKALTGSFFETEDDDCIKFRLTPGPQTYWEFLGIPLPPVSTLEPYYEERSGWGHKNTMGLESEDDLKRLMSAGLLIDVHHMSEKCIDKTLAVAKRYSYPLLKTHTGLRPEPDPSNKADNENSLLPAHAREIMNLGGMIGLGTGKRGGTSPVTDWLDQYRTLMGMKGAIPAGLGTDMNGLDIHFHTSEEDIKPTDYPLTNPCPNIGNHTHQEPVPSMMASMPGCFSFKEKGLAHYGMIPEFLHALDRLDPDGPNGPSIHSLFSSAHAFVKTWELVEEARRHIV